MPALSARPKLHCRQKAFMRLPRIAAHLLFLCRALIVAMTLMSLAGHAVAQPSENQAENSETAFSSSQLTFTQPELITDVVELRLAGRTWRENLRVPDLDVYINGAGQRFIPLLRLLRLLQAKGEFEDQLITFSLRKGKKSSIDLNEKLLFVDSQSQPIEIIRGISDIRGEAEIYVPEVVIALGFDIDFLWSDAEYAYKLTTEQPLRVFEEVAQSRHHKRPLIHHLSSNLVETESTKQAVDSHQLVSIIDTSLRLDTRSLDNAEHKTSSSVKPDITFYGQLGPGNYFLHLTEDITYPDGDVPKLPLWIEEGLWTYEASDTIVRAGDTVIGLNDLVFPSTKFTGVVVRGMFGDGLKNGRSRQFLSGNRFSFMAEKNFSGYALLGSSVEIYVNNRLIDSTVVDETLDAPPGQGQYHFVATGLLNRALNEIRIVIIQPDGSKDEHFENIVGSAALLPAGQTAYSLGIGTKREERNFDVETNGLLLSGGYYHGLSHDATFGLSLATQDDFVQAFNQATSQRLDKRTYLGQTLAYRVFDNVIFREEAAWNFIHETSEVSQAGTLALDYITQPLLLSAYLFNYDQDYSNGTTAVSNRRGYALFGAPTLGNKIQLGATLAQIKESSGERQEDYIAAQARFLSIIPRTEALLRLDHVAERNVPLFTNLDIENTMYSIGLESAPWRSTKLRMEYTQGDRINPVSVTDLRYGVSIPLVGSIPSYGTRINAEYTLPNHNSRVGLTYRDYGQGSESAELTMRRTPRLAGQLDMALRYKRDIERKTNSADINLEYPFDQKRKYLLGMNINYSELSDNIRYNLYLTVRDLFFLDRGHVGRITGTRQIQPRMGGLKGFVYLDANANGHYDKGEPGVPGAQVVVDGRHKLTTGSSGHFFVARNIHQDEVIVELDEIELPAIYTPTQGRQRAVWDDYIFTRVNLGVAVLGSISGDVSQWQDGSPIRPLPGVIVKARNVQNNVIDKQSITDNNGDFYLGELKPGDYELMLEPSSVPPSLRIEAELSKVTLPVSLEPTYIENIHIRVHPAQ